MEPKESHRMQRWKRYRHATRSLVHVTENRHALHPEVMAVYAEEDLNQRLQLGLLARQRVRQSMDAFVDCQRNDELQKSALYGDEKIALTLLSRDIEMVSHCLCRRSPETSPASAPWESSPGEDEDNADLSLESREALGETHPKHRTWVVILGRLECLTNPLRNRGFRVTSAQHIQKKDQLIHSVEGTLVLTDTPESLLPLAVKEDFDLVSFDETYLLNPFSRESLEVVADRVERAIRQSRIWYRSGNFHLHVSQAEGDRLERLDIPLPSSHNDVPHWKSLIMIAEKATQKLAHPCRSKKCLDSGGGTSEASMRARSVEISIFKMSIAVNCLYRVFHKLAKGIDAAEVGSEMQQNADELLEFLSDQIDEVQVNCPLEFQRGCNNHDIAVDVQQLLRDLERFEDDKRLMSNFFQEILETHCNAVSLESMRHLSRIARFCKALHNQLDEALRATVRI